MIAQANIRIIETDRNLAMQKLALAINDLEHSSIGDSNVLVVQHTLCTKHVEPTSESVMGCGKDIPSAFVYEVVLVFNRHKDEVVGMYEINKDATLVIVAQLSNKIHRKQLSKLSEETN